MKKIGKIIFGIIIIAVVLLLALVLTLPLTIGPVVKKAAAVGGPKTLGVPVAVGDVKFSPLAGRLVVTQVKIGNPEGYSDKDAFAVDKLEVGLNVKSLMSDTIVINKIQVDAPAISFETKDKLSNFDKMMANAKKASTEKTEKEKDGKEKSGEGKKVVIEEFSLNNAKISYASGLTLGKAVTLPLPSVTVRDIGKKSEGGTSPAEAISEVLNGILGGISQVLTGAAGSAGDLLKGVGGSATDAVKGASDAAGDAAKAAGSLLKGAGDSASDAAKGLADGAGDAAKAAGDAAKDAAKDAAQSLKKLNPFKK